MKILWIYNYSQKNTYNHWYTGDFMVTLNNLPDIEMHCYGKNMHMLYPNLTVVPYKPEISMQDLKNIYDFDIVILWSKVRYFNNFEETWLPIDFNRFSCPKILIEGDYFKFRKLPWFEEAKFDLILHRHKTNVIRGEEDFPHLKHLWFPVSVDNTIFKPDKSCFRLNKICYLGSSTWQYYYRNKAKEILHENKLLDDKYKTKNQYIYYLQHYISHLNGSSIYSIDNAKAFEIISSGSVLFTNECYNGFPELFNHNYITYKNDFSDLISKAKFILENPDACLEIQKKGLEIIATNHTHLIRANELINIIHRELKMFRPPIITSSSKIPDTLPIPQMDDSSIEKPSLITSIKEFFGMENQQTIKEPVSTPPEPIIEIESKTNEPVIPNPIDQPIEPPIEIPPENLSTKNFNYIKKLLDNNVKVCLLKETCYEAIFNNKFSDHLYLGVDKILFPPNENISLEPYPHKTKQIHCQGLLINVPFPLIDYIEKLYGKTEADKLKKHK